MAATRCAIDARQFLRTDFSPLRTGKSVLMSGAPSHGAPSRTQLGNQPTTANWKRTPNHARDPPVLTRHPLEPELPGPTLYQFRHNPCSEICIAIQTNPMHPAATTKITPIRITKLSVSVAISPRPQKSTDSHILVYINPSIIRTTCGRNAVARGLHGQLSLTLDLSAMPFGGFSSFLIDFNPRVA